MTYLSYLTTETYSPSTFYPRNLSYLQSCYISKLFNFYLTPSNPPIFYISNLGTYLPFYHRNIPVFYLVTLGTYLSFTLLSPGTYLTSIFLLQERPHRQPCYPRNLEARTDNGELLNLVDSTGCPLNELIFPALDLEANSKALFANFKVATYYQILL